jgi:hypothetical protein
MNYDREGRTVANFTKLNLLLFSCGNKQKQAGCK